MVQSLSLIAFALLWQIASPLEFEQDNETTTAENDIGASKQVAVLPPDLSETKACMPRRPVDVIFSVDDFGIGTKRTDTIISLLLEISSHMEHRDEKIKITLLTNKKLHTGPLGQSFFFSNSFNYRLRRLRMPSQADILRRSRRQAKRGRRKVQKTIIHFVDESILLTKEVLKEALRNKAGKIQTYVVAIGRQLDERSLSIMASKPNHHHVIRVDNYDHLTKRWYKILQRICTGW